MNELGGRSALVTGGGSGIGREIVARLERAGMRVLAVDLHPDPGGPGEPLEADLTSREGNREAVETALARFGRLDAVVANAGFQHVSPVKGSENRTSRYTTVRGRARREAGTCADSASE